MKLFIGLGNPGNQYEKTRHNAGFIALEDFCKNNGGTDFLYNNKFKAEISTGIFEKVQFIAIKPMSFMNKSGGPLQAVMQFYNIESKDCLIFHDDIDLASGGIKLKYNGGHGGHNGIRDIYSRTGSKEFWRIKLGVGRPDNEHISVSDYVLGNFSANELKNLHDQDYEIEQRVRQYCKNVGKK